MTARDDARSGATGWDSKRYFFQNASERPFLVAISALLFFVCGVVGNIFLGSSERVGTVIDTVRLDLNQNTDSPASLINTQPLSIDGERADILSDQLIGKAIDQVFAPPSSDSFSETGQRDVDLAIVDPAMMSATVLKGLSVDASLGANEFEISLEPDAVEASEQAVLIVNAVARNYVDLRNQERRQQKEQALAWADRQLAYWQAAIDILRPDSEANVLETVTLAQPPSTDGEKLHGLLLDATKSAQADMLSEIRNTMNLAEASKRKQAIDVLEYNYAKLAKDLERLESVSFQGGQETKPSNLQKAEEKLALFKDDLDKLISSGLLDQPAATIILPAVASQTRPLLHWGVAMPLAAALGILLALILASLITRWKSGNTGKKGVVDIGPSLNVLANPHWPMKPNQ